MTAYERKERALSRLLDAAGVRNFAPWELLFMGGSHSNPNSRAYGLNRLPPDSQLPDAVSNAIVLQEARDILGSPIQILSVYRSPAYNRAVGGAAGSFHRRTLAIDATPSDPSKVRELQRILRELRANGRWTGGLGIYRTFVHIDHGTAYNRDW